ncbi:MAG: hypothetical protein PVJ36_00385 [Nitrospirota bacterium]
MADLEAKRKLIIKVAALLLSLSFFGYIFGLTMNYPFQDPDLWWHLKTGEYIVDNWEVPDEDPFAYTTPRPLGEAKKMGLRAHWLGQVLLYIPYSLAGLAGVALLRNILILLPPLVLFYWLYARRAGPWLALAVAAFPALLLSSKLSYTFERPQGFSFTLALVLVILLERLRARTGKEGWGAFDLSFWLIPVVMALWANIHAGFIVGNVTVMIFLVGEVLRSGFHLLKGSRDEGLRPAFFIVCLAAIAASFVNPNGYELFYRYLSGLAMEFLRGFIAAPGAGGGGQWVGRTVLEYQPLVYFYRELGYTWIIFYWVFTGLLYLVLIAKYWVRRSVDLAELLVVSFFVFFSNYYVRGLMFSLAVLPFYAGKTLLEFRLPGLRYGAFLRGAVVSLLALSLGFFAHEYHRQPLNLKPGITRQWVSAFYPTGLVAFVKGTRPEGPIYNYYTWGGFLIWSLYPDYQVFVDGRALHNPVNEQADAILKTKAGWRFMVGAYDINTIITPVVYRETGRIVPLPVALVYDEQWKLVYSGLNSVLFVRDVPGNRGIIENYSKDKRVVFKEIIRTENILLSMNPRNPVYYISKADALLSLGRFKEAKAIYERFPRRAADKLFQLRQMGY